MSEAEFDRLLNAVREAIEPAPPEDFISEPNLTPKAANDNGMAWPLVPFPDGWHATC